LLKVNEIFGPTIQGEGPAAGQHCLFVRTANCNLECTWCDTPYTWAFTETKADKLEKPMVYDKETNIHDMTEEQVFDELCKLWPMRSQPTIVVISGGEPMMQAEQLEPLAGILRSYGHEIHIETAGTIKPTYLLMPLVSQFVVSPKLNHSGNVLSKRYKPEVLKFFAAQAKSWFKFVVKDHEDLEEIDRIVKDNAINNNRVMIMPEGTTTDKLITTGKLLVNEVVDRGWGLCFRSHIFLWADERGK
jgi:7-carboxy-7-deazaguanine synthase